LSEDCGWLLLNHYGIFTPSEQQEYDLALQLIEEILARSGQNLSLYLLPSPTHRVRPTHGYLNREMQDQLNFDHEQLAQEVAAGTAQMNDGQRLAYEAVMSSIDNENPALFFLDGPGGTGKTFLENLLLASVRQHGGVAIAVASSGIAALLLQGGRTAHSMFKVPLKIEKDSECGIDRQSATARVLAEARLIIWDEAPMQHKFIFEAVDRTMQDCRATLDLFGGCTVVFAGDFRQTLPVIPQAHRSQIVRASLKFSDLWEQTRVLSLTQNMRLLSNDLNDQQREIAQQYNNFIMRVGNGRELVDNSPNLVRLPPSMVLESGEVDDLVDFIYPHIGEMEITVEYLAQRAILAPRNIDVDELNDSILTRVPGEYREYRSADSVEDSDGDVYPNEYLNSLKLPGQFSLTKYFDCYLLKR
jgi:hypothetical protein